MRVMVTGASGFVGIHLMQRLVTEGYEVTGVDWREPPRPVEGWRDIRLDICDDAAVRRAVAEARPEFVWHLAAQASVSVSMREPRLDIETNCIATVTLAQAAAASGARRFVFTSSGGAMFGDPPEIPARDETPAAPRSIYGASKVAAERYLQIVGYETGMEIAGLRPGNIYGPHQNPNGEAGVVAIFTQRMLRGESCIIYGTGSDTRDYVYVEDVIDAQMRAALAPTPAYCLVGTGRETSTREIFELLARETGYERSPAAAPPRPGDIPRISLDTSRAHDLWQWQAKVSLADGLTTP